MSIHAPAPVTVTASLINGKATALLPPRGYRRIITTVNVVNSVAGGVGIYVGIPGAAASLVTYISIGNNNTTTQKFALSPGYTAFAVWDVTPPSLGGAYAKFSWSENSE